MPIRITHLPGADLERLGTAKYKSKHTQYPDFKALFTGLGDLEHLAKEGQRDNYLIERPWKALCDFVTLGEYVSLKYLGCVSTILKNVVPANGDLLAKWAGIEQREALRLIFSRLPDAHSEAGGSVAWLALRWYPITRLIYASGVAAISVEKYENLATILMSPVSFKYGKNQPVIQSAVEEMANVAQAGLIKRLPTHEKHFAPQSEYFFKNIQPAIDDVLFLGRDYEDHFDRFEVMYALITADLYVQEGRRAWGPPGRFGWKYSRDYDGNSLFATTLKEATRLKENWLPLRAGLFGGSFERFTDIAEKYKIILGGLGWF